MTVMNKSITKQKCIFCENFASRELVDELDYFSSKNNKVFLCGKCFNSFSAGSILGQLQLNNKILDLILSAEDEASILSLKERLTNYVPASRNKLFANRTNQTPIVPPKELYEFLNKKVVGQDYAKKRISLALYEHLKGLKRKHVFDKHNILFLGPSGSGKTLIVNTISQKIGVPYVSCDATSFSPTGFQGADAETCIHDLYTKSEGNISQTQKGMVFIDEIDKLASQNHTGTRLESFHHSTQSTLLKLIEGKKVKIPSSASGEPNGVQTLVDTSNILFCFGGAFNGLQDIVAKKMGHTGKLIGFRTEDMNDYEEQIKNYEIYEKAPHDVIVESLIEYGMSTELIGRIQTIVPLLPLNKEQMLNCLLNLEESPIRKNQMLFAESNIEIDFTDDFYNAVVEKAIKTGTGTRALNSIVKTSISDAAFNLLGEKHPEVTKVLFDKSSVDSPSSYQII
jgi:ATP-dependent Clp protease ATP-binding subunit ClpX